MTKGQMKRILLEKGVDTKTIQEVMGLYDLIEKFKDSPNMTYKNFIKKDQSKWF